MTARVHGLGGGRPGRAPAARGSPGDPARPAGAVLASAGTWAGPGRGGGSPSGPATRGARRAASGPGKVGVRRPRARDAVWSPIGGHFWAASGGPAALRQRHRPARIVCPAVYPGVDADRGRAGPPCATPCFCWLILVPGEGLEPPTCGLQNRCSTAELTRRRSLFIS